MRVVQSFSELCNESDYYEKGMQYYFYTLGYTIEDTANNPEYQKIDVDFIARKEGLNPLYVEVKADKQMYSTGNILVEHGHIRPQVGRTKGWFLTCKAHIVSYIDTVNRKVYLINWTKLRPMIREEYNIMRFNNPHDIGTITNGYLIPVSDLSRLGVLLWEFEIRG